MKNFRYSLLILVILIAVGSSTARAGVIVSIDWDSSTPGIQSDVLVPIGDQIIANILLELTGSTSLSSYGFSVRFDTDELNYVSRSESPPPGLDEIDFSNPVSELAGNSSPFGNYGELLRFDGGTLDVGPTSGAFLIGSITFQAVSPSGTTTDVDVRGGNFETLFDNFFDNNGISLLDAGEVTFEGGSVSPMGASAVPEPSTLALGGSLLLALSVARYRRRKKHLATTR